ncbi:MAG: Hpt domain-containing protein [Lysobacterales bacterium]
MVPEALRLRYLQSFPGKIDALQAVSATLTAEGAEARRQLRDLTHKLAGSAGMYGFDDLGLQARAVVHAIDATAADAEIQELLERLLKGLRSAG